MSIHQLAAHLRAERAAAAGARSTSAAPLPDALRLERYRRQSGRSTLTPRQLRRSIQKLRKLGLVDAAERRRYAALVGGAWAVAAASA